MSCSLQPLEPTIYRGVNVNRYGYTYTVGAKENVYDFYTDINSGLPVGFEMLGHDGTPCLHARMLHSLIRPVTDLLGSHYDHYVIVFYSFDPSPAQFPEALFTPPANLTCGGFPGPGLAHKSHNRGGLAVVSDTAMEDAVIPSLSIHEALRLKPLRD